MFAHLMTLMIVVPVVGVLLQAIVEPVKPARWIALFASGTSAVFGFIGVFSLSPGNPESRFTEVVEWVSSYAIRYHLSINGLSSLMILLVSLIFPVLVASEWEQKVGQRGLNALLLLLQASIVGMICAEDLFLQFFFSSTSLIPIYFLVSIWGQTERERSAFRFLCVGTISGALFFVAMILVYYSVDPHTFSLSDLSGGKLSTQTFEFLGNEFSISKTALLLMCVSAALRIPIWPIHGWFSQFIKEAPFSVLVAVSAVWIPANVVFFARSIYSLFPELVVGAATPLVVIGLVNLFVGAMGCIAQKNLRDLLSYVVLLQIGLVFVGIGSLDSAGFVGAYYHLMAMGLTLAAFGLFSGAIHQRISHVDFYSDSGEKQLGGVVSHAPWMAVVAGIATLSVLGFPGFVGFVGSSLLLIGSHAVNPAVLTISIGSIVIATYALFSVYQVIFLGSTRAEGSEKVFDLSLREKIYLLPLVVAIVAAGTYPKPLIDLIRPAVLTLLSTVR